ncbi:uncharacterized protein [Palaemon carinicauda]|uniref:uncharacterized protein n=1 Tax=Palaemon carinicauda TaxID=392227 RepID=UPI0035B62532
MDVVDLGEDNPKHAAAFLTLHSISNMVPWEMFGEAMSSDEILSKLADILQNVMPSRYHDFPPALRSFHPYAQSLSCLDSVILMGHRIVIPTPQRRSVLTSLHAAHQGINVMCQWAADSVFWPSISTDISKVREECAQCHRIIKLNAMQPPSDINLSDYSFQKVCCDYFLCNNTEYLVLVDRYSNWPMVFRSQSGADGLIKHLRESFVIFGIPEDICQPVIYSLPCVHLFLTLNIFTSKRVRKGSKFTEKHRTTFLRENKISYRK